VARDDDYDEPIVESPEADSPEEGPQPRDARTDDAKDALLRYIAANPDGVWYERQLVVMFEQARRQRPYLQGEGFFHWISRWVESRSDRCVVPR